MNPAYRPHDLLFAHAAGGFVAAGAAPDWDAGWIARAPLVVRRDALPGGRIPVGARGPRRSQRSAGHLLPDAVARCVTPERLAAAVLDGPALDLITAADGLPAIATLLALAPRLRDLGLNWGPGGGTGFWLASGLPALRPDSDLDLIVRAPRALTPLVADALRGLQEGAACRIDIQVDTGAGGFALNDYLRGGRVLLKTAAGPLLVADPWQTREAA